MLVNCILDHQHRNQFTLFLLAKISFLLDLFCLSKPSTNWLISQACNENLHYSSIRHLKFGIYKSLPFTYYSQIPCRLGSDTFDFMYWSKSLCHKRKDLTLRYHNHQSFLVIYILIFWLIILTYHPILFHHHLLFQSKLEFHLSIEIRVEKVIKYLRYLFSHLYSLNSFPKRSPIKLNSYHLLLLMLRNYEKFHQ